MTILISFLVLTFNLNKVHAQSIPKQYLSITPIISELKIEPGKKMGFDIKVKNLSNSPVGIHAEPANLLEPDTEQAEEISSPLIKWTTLSQNDFILSSLEEKSIKVTINPPKDIKEGSFYEVIFLTPFTGGQKNTEKPVVLSRVGAIIFATNGQINYKNLKEKVSIDNFSTDGFLITKPNFTMNLEVSNKYFSHFSAKPNIVVKPLLGKAQNLIVEEKHILPGMKRVWEIPTEVKSWGIYQADLALSVGNGEQILRSRWFLFMPVKELLISILILFVILIFGFRRKSLKKAIKILISPANKKA